MKETRLIMGMPISVEIVDTSATQESLEKVFSYFSHIDETFSTYKDTSEIMSINRGETREEDASNEMKQVLALSEETKTATLGYFNIKKFDNTYDPSGLVKGWAIKNAADILIQDGFQNFCIDAGGDIQTSGHNTHQEKWVVGIRNPFNRDENVKVLHVESEGVATSGTYIRGQHIYNPHQAGPLEEIKSFTVIGPNIYEADRFATAAFAMGKKGIYFIENLDGFEGYMIDRNGLGTSTSGLILYTQKL
jgi:thiamine biosynthesis lipoprotein